MTITRRSTRRRDEGFTLAEVLVSMGVVGILLAVVGIAVVRLTGNQDAVAATQTQQAEAVDAANKINQDVALADTLLFGDRGELILQGTRRVDAVDPASAPDTDANANTSCWRVQYVIDAATDATSGESSLYRTYADTCDSSLVPATSTGKRWTEYGGVEVLRNIAVPDGENARPLFAYLDKYGYSAEALAEVKTSDGGATAKPALEKSKLIAGLPVSPGRGSEEVALVKTDLSGVVDSRDYADTASVVLTTDTAINSVYEEPVGEASSSARCAVVSSVVTGPNGPIVKWTAPPASQSAVVGYIVMRDGRAVSGGSATNPSLLLKITDSPWTDQSAKGRVTVASYSVATVYAGTPGDDGSTRNTVLANCPARVYAPPAGVPLLSVPVTPTGVAVAWTSTTRPVYGPSWTPVDGAVRYELYGSVVSASGVPGTAVLRDTVQASTARTREADGVTFVLPSSGFASAGSVNELIDWKVVAVDAAGGRKTSSTVSTRTHMTTTLTATPTTYGTNTVTWTAPPGYATQAAVTRYELHRYSVDPDASIAPLTAARKADTLVYSGRSQTFADTGVELGSTYRYYVVVVSRVGSDGVLANGPRSVEDDALQFPPPIEFVPNLADGGTPYVRQNGSSTSNVGDGRNLVMWEPSKSATTYDVYRFRYDSSGNRFGGYATVAANVAATSGRLADGRAVRYLEDRGVSLGSQWRYAVFARNATGISPGPDGRTAATAESIKTSDNSFFMYVTQRPSGSSINQTVTKNAVYRTESYTATESYYDVASASWKTRTVTRYQQVVDYYDVTVRWNENGDAGNPEPYKFCDGATSNDRHTSYCKYEVSKNGSVVASSLGAREYLTRLYPGENATFTVRSCNQGGCSDASATAEVPRDQIGGFAITSLDAPSENIYTRTGDADYKNADGRTNGLYGNVSWSAASGAVKYKWGRGDGRTGETRGLTSGPIDMYPDRAYTYTVVACATEACPDSDPANRRISGVVQAPPGHPRYVSTIQQCQAEKNDDGVGNSKWKLALHLDNRPLEGNLSGTYISQFERNSDEYAGRRTFAGVQVGSNASIDLLTGEMGKGTFESGVRYSEAWWAVQNYAEHGAGVLPAEGYSYARLFGLSAGSNNPWAGQCQRGSFGDAPMNQNNYPNSFPDITKWEARR